MVNSLKNIRDIVITGAIISVIAYSAIGFYNVSMADQPNITCTIQVDGKEFKYTEREPYKQNWFWGPITKFLVKQSEKGYITIGDVKYDPNDPKIQGIRSKVRELYFGIESIIQESRK